MGRPRADDRRTLDAILFILRTGSAGATCPQNSARLQPLGTCSRRGKKTALGSASGEQRWLLWKLKTNCSGHKPFWTAALFRPKKGMCRRPNQKGQRHQMDAGVRWPGTSHRLSSGECQPCRGQVGTGYAANSARKKSLWAGQNPSAAVGRRPRLRQPCLSAKFEKARHQGLHCATSPTQELEKAARSPGHSRPPGLQAALQASSASRSSAALPGWATIAVC